APAHGRTGGTDEERVGGEAGIGIDEGHTANIPRTQVTIWGAPKAMAMPKMAARHHPQEIRLAIAMAPRAMTRMMGTGVSQARMLVWRAVAPVMKGDAACARTTSGATVQSSRRTTAVV